MSEHGDGHLSPEARKLVRRLVKETGITEEKAAELIAVLGYDWSSLIREARVLAQRRGGG